MTLKSDIEAENTELKTQVKFTVDLLDKKSDELFALRQENLQLKKKLNIIPKEPIKLEEK